MQKKIETNETNIVTINARHNYGYVNSGTNAVGWHKAAECIFTEASYAHRQATFHVAGSYSSVRYVGFLNVLVVSDMGSTLGCNDVKASWISRTKNINPKDFVVIAKLENNKIIAELWVNLSIAYISYNFTILESLNRVGENYYSHGWKCCNSTTASESYPSDYNKIIVSGDYSTAKYDADGNDISAKLTTNETDISSNKQALKNHTSSTAKSLNVEGWYRFFIYNSYVETEAKASSAMMPTFIISRVYNTINNEAHKIDLNGVYNKITFLNENSISIAQIITKIRMVATSNKSYVDIYYSSTKGNVVSGIVTNSCANSSESIIRHWEAIATPYAVEETVDGETVLASYEFSANRTIESRLTENKGTLVTSTYSCTAINTYECTGLSVTVPANSVYEIKAYDRYGNSAPKGICIATTSDSSKLNDNTMIAESTTNISTGTGHFICRSTSGIAPKESDNKTYYVHVIRSTTSSNQVGLWYRRLN